MGRKNNINTTWKGYGSVYKKVNLLTGATDEGIDVVLGGQIWKVKPDKKEKIKNPCIWMQAGVVKAKSCTNFYDCTTCSYDKAMMKKVKEGKILSWQDALRKLPPKDRICRHTLTQRIPYRLCAYDYHCDKCDFDQYLEDVVTPKQASKTTEVYNIKGFDLPVGYYFHNGHTWARIESGGYIRIGMDDFSLKLLGEMDKFELPLIGKVLDPDAPGWGLKKKDKQAEVLSPAGGIICEVNHKLFENPTVANSSPYEDGWMFLIRTNDIKASMKKLMDDKESMPWLQQEVSVLENMVEEVAGPLAADGGLFASNIYDNLPQLGWENLTKTFLKTR